MIQVIIPDSFVPRSHLMRDSYIRVSPKRGEIILSPHLLSTLGFKKGGHILFAIDSQVDEIFVALDKDRIGFKVNLDKNRGRIYSVSLLKLFERTLSTTIIDPISIHVEAIPKIYNDVRLHKLFTDGLKQVETDGDDTNAIVWYKGKPYDKRTWLAKIRAYWDRSKSSARQLTRERNLKRYEEIKDYSISYGLEIDFVDIETTPI